MNTYAFTTAAALLTASTCALASDGTSAPDAGTYAGGIYIATSTSGCLDKSGYAYFAEVSFDGLSGSKHYIRVPLVGSPGAVMSTLTLTVTSGKGTTKLGGTLAWIGTGIGGGWDVTGTFSAAITEIGAHSFVTQMKLSYTDCSEEDWNVSLTRMGAYQ